MNILIISFFYFPDLSAGSFRTKALTNQLIKNDDKINSITVITTMPNRYKDYKVKAKIQSKLDKLNIYRVNIPNTGSGKIYQIICHIIFSLKAYFLIRGKEFDIVYVTSSKLLTAFFGSLISRIYKKPLYLDLRDIFLDVLSDTGNRIYNTFLLPLIGLVEKLTVLQADKINLVSEGFKEYFENKYPNKKYSFFTNGIDEEFINLRKEKIIDLSKKEKLNILYAGNIGLGQSLEYIIPDLAKSLGNRVHFKIIGSGSALSKIKKKISLINCTNVQIFAPKERTEIIKEYYAADILFLHLNNKHSFKKVLPSKIFEYAATGKPILAGVSGYAKKFLEQEVVNSWIFEPSNLSEALLQFDKIKVNWSDRKKFIMKYDRRIVQQNIIEDLLSTFKNNKYMKEK